MHSEYVTVLSRDKFRLPGGYYIDEQGYAIDSKGNLLTTAEPFDRTGERERQVAGEKADTARQKSKQAYEAGFNESMWGDPPTGAEPKRHIIAEKHKQFFDSDEWLNYLAGYNEGLKRRKGLNKDNRKISEGTPIWSEPTITLGWGESKRRRTAPLEKSMMVGSDWGNPSPPNPLRKSPVVVSAGEKGGMIDRKPSTSKSIKPIPSNRFPYRHEIPEQPKSSEMQGQQKKEEGLLIMGNPGPGKGKKVAPDRWRTRISKYDTQIQDAAAGTGVDAFLYAAMIRAESNFNPNAKGRKLRDGRQAMGLAQFLRATAKQYGIRNRFDPNQSIKGLVSYTQDLVKIFRDVSDDDRMLFVIAAYNHGQGNVKRAMQRARRAGRNAKLYRNVEAYLPRETRRHVQKVMNFYNGYVSAERSATRGQIRGSNNQASR